MEFSPWMNIEFKVEYFIKKHEELKNLNKCSAYIFLIIIVFITHLFLVESSFGALEKCNCKYVLTLQFTFHCISKPNGFSKLLLAS